MQGEPSDASDDAELIRAAGSDPSAFGVLYERHALAIYSWCNRRLGWAASDLTAETFAQAWLSRDRFRDEHGGSAFPWLLGIARNVLRETIRCDRVESRARERLGLPADLAQEDGFAAVEARLSPRLALATALGDLPEHEREPLDCAFHVPFGALRSSRPERTDNELAARKPRALPY
jgi:DNA-directed RNA polymerase specialized sigma24 family protein